MHTIGIGSRHKFAQVHSAFTNRKVNLHLLTRKVRGNHHKLCGCFSRNSCGLVSHSVITQMTSENQIKVFTVFFFLTRTLLLGIF